MVMDACHEVCRQVSIGRIIITLNPRRRTRGDVWPLSEMGRGIRLTSDQHAQDVYSIQGDAINDQELSELRRVRLAKSGLSAQGRFRFHLRAG